MDTLIKTNKTERGRFPRHDFSSAIQLNSLIDMTQQDHQLASCRCAKRTAELRDANEQLCREIAYRKRTEAELEKSLSLLHATLQSTADGIVAVSLSGDIVTFNQKFVDMWQIPDAIITSQDCDQCLDFLRNQLKNPETFDRVFPQFEEIKRI